MRLSKLEEKRIENIQNNRITGIITTVAAIAAGYVIKKNLTQHTTVISSKNKNIPKLNKSYNFTFSKRKNMNSHQIQYLKSKQILYKHALFPALHN